MRVPALLVFAAVAVCAVSGKTPVDLQVTAVRCWAQGEVTRIVIETNRDFGFQRDRLANPDRLFFDILDARPKVRGMKVSPRLIRDKFLKQIRIAENMPGRTRVVLDLNRAVDYSVSKLENPDRLIIELRARPDQKKPEPAPAVISTAPVPSLPVLLPASAAVGPPVSTPAAIPVGPPVTPIAMITPPPSTPVQSPPTLLVATPASPRTAVESASPARKATADGSHSLIRALGLKINRVVIDAGHGGHDVGTSGPTGLLEKDLVLDVALRLGKLVEQRLGSEVIYTRQDDSYVPLEERTAIANRSHADLFLSIHANSSPVKSVTGVETFYLNFTSAEDALDVAARENASSQKSIFELRDLIQSISLHDKIDESKEFANDLQRSMQAQAVRRNSSIKDRGIKRAPFVVLIGAQMPSVLSEIGFISNPREEASLKRPEYRQQIAEALYKGLARYADSLSHLQMATAQ